MLHRFNRRYDNMLRAVLISYVILSAIKFCQNGRSDSTRKFEIGTSSSLRRIDTPKPNTSIFNRILSKKSKVSLLQMSFSSLENFIQAVTVDQTVSQGLTQKFDVNKLAGQFYLFPYQKSLAQTSPYDINVLRVWLEDQNYGQNVIVMIISDGLDTRHPDLKDNYNANYGYDFVDNDDIPDPDLTHNRNAFHGTRAAGIIAMKLETAVCGIGVAPYVTLGAIRLIGPQNKVNVENFISALRYKITEIDITLLTWEQMYQQKAISSLQQEIHKAYEESVVQGRHGRGIIHVIPAGAGGPDMYLPCSRNVNVNTIYTIVVAASDYNGRMNEYSASCSAVMVTAYSTKINPNQTPDTELEYEIVSVTLCKRTTDVNKECTGKYGNAEAAASIVAGVIALALRANEHLTWRDVQHLIAFTSEASPMHNEKNAWVQNKAGYYVSPFFGFGMINTYNLVRTAKTFKPVPPMAVCERQFPEVNDSRQKPIFQTLPRLRLGLNVDGCKKSKNEVNFIEHIQLLISVRHRGKNKVAVKINSPGGTPTIIGVIPGQSLRYYTGEFHDWVFDSVQNWGESPKGYWVVEIYNLSRVSIQTGNRGEVLSLTLRIYGTKQAPLHYHKRRLSCCLPRKLRKKQRSYLKPTPKIIS